MIKQPLDLPLEEYCDTRIVFGRLFTTPTTTRH